jgi:hypothetical protein
MNGVLTARDHEFGNIDAPLGIDVAQYALKLILGPKDSGYAREDPKIGILKRMFTCDRSLPRLGVPRAELAFCPNIFGRQRDMERNREGRGILVGNGIESQRVDSEQQRFVMRRTIDLHRGTIRNDFTDSRARRGFLPV